MVVAMVVLVLGAKLTSMAALGQDTAIVQVTGNQQVAVQVFLVARVASIVVLLLVITVALTAPVQLVVEQMMVDQAQQVKQEYV
jgi:hypothetical protein